MNRKNILLALAFVLIQGVIATVKCQNARPATIIEALSISDSATNATVRIYQDKRIEQLVSQKKSSSTAKHPAIIGFQVDNEVEARGIDNPGYAGKWPVQQ
jgi:hypothetical protein